MHMHMKAYIHYFSYNSYIIYIHTLTVPHNLICYISLDRIRFAPGHAAVLRPIGVNAFVSVRRYEPPSGHCLDDAVGLHLMKNFHLIQNFERRSAPCI